MNYCGIDIGGLSSYVYVSDGAGRKKWCGPVKTSRGMLEGTLKHYVRSGLKVAIEAGNQTAWVYAVLVEMGAEVIVVNPHQVKLIAMSRKKTDKVDVRILCELCAWTVCPSRSTCRRLRCVACEACWPRSCQLVQARTKLQNVVRGMLRQEGTQLRGGACSRRSRGGSNFWGGVSITTIWR